LPLANAALVLVVPAIEIRYGVDVATARDAGKVKVTFWLPPTAVILEGARVAVGPAPATDGCSVICVDAVEGVPPGKPVPVTEIAVTPGRPDAGDGAASVIVVCA